MHARPCGHASRRRRWRACEPPPRRPRGPAAAAGVWACVRAGVATAAAGTQAGATAASAGTRASHRRGHASEQAPPPPSQPLRACMRDSAVGARASLCRGARRRIIGVTGWSRSASLMLPWRTSIRSRTSQSMIEASSFDRSAAAASAPSWPRAATLRGGAGVMAGEVQRQEQAGDLRLGRAATVSVPGVKQAPQHVVAAAGCAPAQPGDPGEYLLEASAHSVAAAVSRGREVREEKAD